MNFQTIIQKLNDYWSQQGCCLVLPDDLEKGAATFTHHTTLRALGPEPIAIAHPDPSRRPSDGRYGKSPNRLQLFHQYQVVIKPAKENIIQLYLDSLELIGLKRSLHDIRFVQDDWESPTLGAWGLGWEVWVDGMEVTQFTYFQSVAGIEMELIPVEIAYGLERLAMLINKKDNIYDVPFNDLYSYGDLFHEREVECSQYNLELASKDLWFNSFDAYEKEAKLLCEHHLPLPAYDFVLKASHAFNLLDSRGFISITERQSYILRVRTLATLVAQAYLKLREQKDFPLLKHLSPFELKTIAIQPVFNLKEQEDVLFEIYAEDLPSHYVKRAIDDLFQKTKTFLENNHLTFSTITPYSTQHRLALLIEGLQTTQSAITETKQGPKIDYLFDEKGEATKVAINFFKSNNLPLPTLEDLKNHRLPNLHLETNQKGTYLILSIKHEPKSTLDLLSHFFPEVISQISFPKTMRWNQTQARFARPIRNLVAMMGAETISFVYGNVESGTTTFGHTQLDQKTISLTRPKDYESLLLSHKVIVDPKKREELIKSKLPKGVLAVERLLPELVYLSEYPMIETIQFDPSFLSIPRELVELECIIHQRYFPIEKEGQLTNLAAIVCDQIPNNEMLINYNRVLSARLKDGLFFYQEDQKKGLQAMQEALDSLLFQKDLGSLKDKIQRMEQLASVVKRFLPHDEAKLKRAIALCKCDLVSLAVGEFPELQGVMGGYYAEIEKEDKEVAVAIKEQYLPNTEDSPTPSTKLGALLSFVDKLDNLLAFSFVNLGGTSSKDPYALRRQAKSLIRIIADLQIPFDFEELIEKASFLYLPLRKEGANEELPIDILRSRLKGFLAEYGAIKEEIEALLASKLNIAQLLDRLQKLRDLRKNREIFLRFIETYRRVKGQAKEHIIALETQSFKEATEIALFKKWESVHRGGRFEELIEFKPYVDALFDALLIQDPNLEIRKKREQLLYLVAKCFEEWLDPTPLYAL